MARKPRNKKPARNQPANKPRNKPARSPRAAKKRGPAVPPKTAAAAAEPLTPDPGPLTSEWADLLTVATPEDAGFLSELVGRSSGELAEIEALADLAASPEELARLGLILDRLPRSAAALANADAGEQHRRRSARRQREIATDHREIGPLPPVADIDRRESCRFNFRLFCETYCKASFPLDWSQDHRKAITKIEHATLRGGLFALAMPRGNGKSTLCEAAVLWAVLYGHAGYVFLIHASDKKAVDSLEGLKTELESNDLLAADFPEVCYPISRLERIAQRAPGQLLNGEHTRMTWKGTQLVLPTVPGSDASNAIIGASGLLTATRGAKFRAPGGKIRRPDLVIIDDPQTDESAASVDQCDKREEIIANGLLGMAGPGKKIAAVMPCTVIKRGDLADRILDREKNPHWRGERCKMLLSFPDRMDLWEEWYELVREALKKNEIDPEQDDLAPAATRFIEKRYDEMHAGAEVSWPERKYDWQLSAVHHAMGLFFQNEKAFHSEYQNEPQDPAAQDDVFLSGDQIAVKLSGYDRLEIPPEVQWLTAFCDVHARVLYYCLMGFERNFTGHVLDYGTWPEQGRDVFYAGRAKPTLLQAYKGQGQEGAIYSGLQHVANHLLGRQYTRQGGAQLGVSLMLIDAGYQATVVRRFIRESQHAARMRPSFGKAIGCNEIPISQYRARPGEFIGDEWLLGIPKSGGTPHVTFDANHWKLHTQRRLATQRGDPGALCVWGKDGSRTRHDFLGRHLAAEYGRPVQGRRRVVEFAPRPGESENHWGDCVVGCNVAASICGARVGGTLVTIHKKRKKREARYLD